MFMRKILFVLLQIRVTLSLSLIICNSMFMDNCITIHLQYHVHVHE